jgi:hypothetical protein
MLSSCAKVALSLRVRESIVEQAARLFVFGRDLFSAEIEQAGRLLYEEFTGSQQQGGWMLPRC